MRSVVGGEDLCVVLEICGIHSMFHFQEIDCVQGEKDLKEIGRRRQTVRASMHDYLEYSLRNSDAFLCSAIDLL